jgi:hypothetical protein
MSAMSRAVIVREVGDDRGDAAGRGALERIDEDEQLEDRVAHARIGGLDDEDVVLADVLVDLGEDVLVGELDDLGFAERHPEVATDSLG